MNWFQNAFAALAALSVAAAPHAYAGPGMAPAANPETVGFDSDRLKLLDAYMAKVVADGKVAGMTTLLARHGRLVEFNTYGKASLASGAPMSKDAIFRVYSMSKPLTGVAMMILFEEGRWRLDDPVTRFVPQFANLKVMTGVDASGKILVEDMKRPPTMREIMSHTAGFGYGLQTVNPVDKLYREKQVLNSTSLQQMVDRTAEIPLKFQPGTAWAYSNAVDIQGYIVEKLTGESLERFMQERIFKPLRMTDTGFMVRPGAADRLAGVYDGFTKDGKLEETKELFGFTMPDYTKAPPYDMGGGGIVSTTTDYARFCQMILNKGELDGVRILSPASVELMDTNAIPKSVLVSNNGTGWERFDEATGFGLDFMVVADPRKAGSLEGKNTMSWGGAAGTWFWIDPTNDVLFVGMIQRFGGVPGDDLGSQARTLTYQALTHPEK